MRYPLLVLLICDLPGVVDTRRALIRDSEKKKVFG